MNPNVCSPCSVRATTARLKAIVGAARYSIKATAQTRDQVALDRVLYKKPKQTRQSFVLQAHLVNLKLQPGAALPSQSLLDSDKPLPTVPRHSLYFNLSCSGCGCPLQSDEPDSPGYIDPVAFSGMQTSSFKGSFRKGRAKPPPLMICARCQSLASTNHGSAVQNEHEPIIAPYQDHLISELKRDSQATILLVGDMTNLPNSLVPNIGHSISNSRVVLIGNKADQLPIDGPNYLNRWSNALLQAANSKCDIPKDRIERILLVSALTGYGIPSLLDLLLSREFHRLAPIYLVGCSNVGKSSLFNRLLMSDLCKIEARQATHRAIVTQWPGTTINVLKFPFVQMNASKRALREEAKRKLAELESNQTIPTVSGFQYLPGQVIPVSSQHSTSRLQHSIDMAQSSVGADKGPFNLPPTYVRQTDGDDGQELVASSVDLTRQVKRLKDLILDELGRWEGDRSVRLLTQSVDTRDFHPKAWLYDTPGLDSQSCQNSHLEELDFWTRHSYKPKSRLVPRTFILRPGHSLLLGFSARLDLVEAPPSCPVYLTTFTNFPIHIVNQVDADAYIAELSQRLNFPHVNQLTSCDLGPLFAPTQSIQDGDHRLVSIVDVVFNDLGWIAVTANFADLSSIALRGWALKETRVILRRPSMIPHAVNRRGRRISGLREFRGIN